MEKYSYSKISLYSQCPYKYKKLYIEKLPSKIAWQTCLGISTADILEKMYKDEEILSNYACGPTPELLICLIEQYWIPNQYKKQFAESNLETHKFLCYPSKPAELREKENLLKYLTFYFKYRKLEKKFGVELPFEVPFDDFLLTGRIDLLNKVGNHLDIIDNKVTSNFLNDTFESIQLGIYYYAIKKLFPRFQIGKVGYYYIKQSREVLINSDLLKVDIIYRKIRDSVEGIRNKKFNCSPNQYCNFCEFKNECGA
jgi:hypothetical protein